MAISHVQNVGSANAVGSPATVLITPRTLNNNLMMVFGGCGNTAAVLSISDTAGHNWVPAVSLGNDGVGTAGASWYAWVKSIAQITITMTSTVNTFTNVLVDEWDGVDFDNPIGSTTTASGSGTPSAALALPGSNMAIWAACNDSVLGAGTGFTIAADDGSGDQTEYQIFVGQSGTNQIITFNGSGQFFMQAVSLRERQRYAYANGTRFRVPN